MLVMGADSSVLAIDFPSAEKMGIYRTLVGVSRTA
jgi:hypothetical protein